MEQRDRSLADAERRTGKRSGEYKKTTTGRIKMGRRDTAQSRARNFLVRRAHFADLDADLAARRPATRVVATREASGQ